MAKILCWFHAGTFAFAGEPLEHPGTAIASWDPVAKRWAPKGKWRMLLVDEANAPEDQAVWYIPTAAGTAEIPVDRIVEQMSARRFTLADADNELLGQAARAAVKRAYLASVKAAT